MPVAIGCSLVPVAVDVKVRMLADVDVDAADVIVDVAHDAREMSAAITSQKKPALNIMAAVFVEQDLEYSNAKEAAMGVH